MYICNNTIGKGHLYRTNIWMGGAEGTVLTLDISLILTIVPLSLTHTLSLSLSISSQTLAISLTHTHTRSLSISHTLPPTHTLSLTPTHAHSLSCTHSLALSLPHSLSPLALFLGSESPCHRDPFHNILCQIYGEKKVILFAPSEEVILLINLFRT